MWQQGFHWTPKSLVGGSVKMGLEGMGSGIEELKQAEKEPRLCEGSVDDQKNVGVAAAAAVFSVDH